jgi:hypothetical protein
MEALMVMLKGYSEIVEDYMDIYENATHQKEDIDITCNNYDNQLAKDETSFEE